MIRERLQDVLPAAEAIRVAYVSRLDTLVVLSGSQMRWVTRAVEFPGFTAYLDQAAVPIRIEISGARQQFAPDFLQRQNIRRPVWRRSGRGGAPPVT